MSHLLLFPSPVFYYNCEDYLEHRDKFISHCYELKSKSSGVIKSNQGGWQSENNQAMMIMDYIAANFTNLVKDFSGTFNILNHWVNINSKGDFNRHHSHPDSILSGVMWLKCKDNSGDIVFESPNAFVHHRIIKRLNDDFCNENHVVKALNIKPKEGQIILFPSDLIHFVLENKEDSDRISIAFNVELV